MLKKKNKKQMQSIMEVQSSKRNIDQAIKETFNNLGKRFILVSKLSVNTWKSLVIIAFIAGVFGVLIWSISQDEMTKIYLAEKTEISNQASLVFEDEQGNKYGPVTSNVVVTKIKNVISTPIKINIKLEGKQTFDSAVVIYVLAAGTENIIFQATGITGANGKVELSATSTNIPNGVYDFRIKASRYLSKKIASITWPSALEIDFGGALAGNLQDDDDEINSLDWSLMSNKWGTNDASADINKDGIVNALDWSLMNKNWGKKGN